MNNDRVLIRVDKQRHHLVGKRIDERHGEYEIDHHHAHGVTHACLNAVYFACANVLPAISGHRDADVLEYAGKEIFDANGCRERSYIERAEGIVSALQHDDANGSDGELQSHRHAIVKQDANLLVIESALITPWDEHRHAPLDEAPAQP